MKYLDFNTQCNSNNIPFPIHNQILWDGKQSAHGKESPPKTAGSGELLREATQLLKTLRLPSVKRLQKIDGYDGTKDLVVLDSGATHILRQARDERVETGETNTGGLGRRGHRRPEVVGGNPNSGEQAGKRRL